MKLHKELFKILALIVLLLPSYEPIINNTANVSTGLAASAMQGKEDVFCGKFSEQNINVSAGQAFEVSFAITPTIDLSNVTIRLMVPEGLMHLVEGDEVWRGNVEKGETVVLTYSLSAEEEVDECVRVNVEGYSSDGSYCSSNYGLRVITPMKPVDSEELGSRYVPVKRIDVISPDQEYSIDPNLAKKKKIRIRGAVVYTDDEGDYSPMRRVKVWLRDDEPGRPDEWVASQYTDDSGRFDFTVNNDDGTLQDGRDPYVEVESINTVAVCQEGYTDIRPYVMRLDNAGNDVPNGFDYNYGVLYPLSMNEAWRAIDYALTEADWIWARVSWGRPKINIYWPKGDWPQFVHLLGSTVEHIELPQEPYSQNRYDWGQNDVYHEFAHAVMYQLYGNSMPSGDGPSPHYLWSESSLGFALSEGWAEFMECAVSNDINACGGNIEANAWYNQEDSGQIDGDVVEGSVASILWDIFDLESQADNDNLCWGFEEIFYILKRSNPENMHIFWSSWTRKWPSLHTSVGPLCTIFWNYGIDKDKYPPEILDQSALIYSDLGEDLSPFTDIDIKFYVTYYASGRPPRMEDNVIDYGSGIAYMRFRNSPKSSWSDWLPYENKTSWTLSTDDGKKYVYVQLIDNKGLLSKIYFDSIILDTTPPSGSIVINSRNPPTTSSRSVNLYLTYSDTSGVKSVRYSNDGVWDTESLEGPSKTKNWILSPSNGLKTVYYQVQDKAGLVSTFSDEIYLNESKPAPVLVIRGTSNKIYYSVGKRNGGWEGWINLPGMTTELSPAAEVLDDDLHIVVVAKSGELWHGCMSIVTRIFSGWKKISGSTPSPPALTAGYGGLILVVRGQDNQISYNTWNRTSWGEWTALAGATDQGPAAVAVGLHTRSCLHIVIRGIDGYLRHGWVYLDSKAFSGWNNITGAILHRPVLDALWGRDSTSPVLVLVARGLDDNIIYRTWNGLVGWRDWETVPGLTTSVGPASTVMENKFYIVARGKDGKFYCCYKDLINGIWTPWTNLSGTCLSSPDLSTWN